MVRFILIAGAAALLASAATAQTAGQNPYAQRDAAAEEGSGPAGVDGAPRVQPRRGDPAVEVQPDRGEVPESGPQGPVAVDEELEAARRAIEEAQEDIPRGADRGPITTLDPQ